MPLGMLSRVNPRNHILDGSADPPWQGAILMGRACPDMPDDTDMNCAKAAELIEMLFGLWTLVGPRKHVLHGAQVPMQRGNY